MKEVKVGEHDYRVGKLSPKRQFHIARRLAPAMWALGVAGATETPEGQNPMSRFKPVAEIIAKMTDEESEYVINTCLSVVARKQGTAWAQVTTSDGQMIFEDIDLQAMMQLTRMVIEENLGNFFNGVNQSV